MSTMQERINSIHAKLQLLLKKYAALQNENEVLLHAIKACRENEKGLSQKIGSLEVQAGILKASVGKMNDKEKHDFDKRINQYIKDIDKCMAILNN
ncbi:MAG: hypothetical protein ABI472_13380 [Ginsengibacter sp.]